MRNPCPASLLPAFPPLPISLYFILQAGVNSSTAAPSEAAISFPLTREGYHYAGEQFSVSLCQGGAWRVARVELAKLREAVYAK